MIMAGLLRLSRPPPVTRSSMLVVVRRIGPFLTGGVPALHAQDTQLARVNPAARRLGRHSIDQDDPLAIDHALSPR